MIAASGHRKRHLVTTEKLEKFAWENGRQMEADHAAGLYIVKASSGIELAAPFGGEVAS